MSAISLPPVRSSVGTASDIWTQVKSTSPIYLADTRSTTSWGEVDRVLSSSAKEIKSGAVHEGLGDAGIASLQCHRQYLAGLSGDLDPASFLRDQAATTGALAGVEAAVAFEVIFT